jgi:archaeosine-15-forming tRNA-guanine transglycosylase
MLSRLGIAIALLLAALAPAAAHHGWGSYDARNPVTVDGKILTSKFENPHVTLTVQGTDRVWTLTLAPTSRMLNRGALKDMVATGKTISAYGYPSTATSDEMRAERITVDGKTVEMR